FVVTGWLFDRRPPKRNFSAVAHEESIVAVWSQQAIAEMLERLPPAPSSHLMSYGWRAFSSLLHQKFLMLSMDLPERLLFQLRVLARDHGQPYEGIPAGVVITLRLTQQDLADLVIAVRPNVARAFRKLRDAGFVASVDRRMLVTQRSLAEPPAT